MTDKLFTCPACNGSLGGCDHCENGRVTEEEYYSAMNYGLGEEYDDCLDDIGSTDLW